MIPSVAKPAVLRILQCFFSPILALTTISEGEESQTFSFLSGTDAYIVRINPGEEGFAKDDFAFRHFERESLPIPQVIKRGIIEDCFFCISKRLPGVTLQASTPEELPSVLAPTAGVLDAIAKSDLAGLSGFGPFDENGKGQYSSWHDFLVRGSGVEEVNPLLGRIRLLASHCPEIRALVHGDFGSNNVLIDEGRVSGVLDWSEALIGDPLYDVANIFFWRPWLNCMEQQARYFESVFGNVLNLAERLLCYQLRIGISEVGQSASAGKSEAQTWAWRRCEDLLRTAI